jgi:hypothetical protein
MRLVNAPKFVADEFKLIFGKVTHHKKTDESPDDHLFDSGLSVVGDWILDLAVVALVAVVAGAVLKWAYLAIFRQ